MPHYFFSVGSRFQVARKPASKKAQRAKRPARKVSHSVHSKMFVFLQGAIFWA